MRQFASYVERGRSIDDLGSVSREVVDCYLAAPTSEGFDPGVSLQYFRRLAVRTLFRIARQLGLEVGDPTVDAALPARTPAAFRPLEDDEVELARAAAVGSIRRARAAAAWALCEATARTGEMPWIRQCDLDLASRRVWIQGTPRTLARWGELTDWGHAQLGRYLAIQQSDPLAPLICGGEPGSALAQSSAVGAISQTLTRAGLSEAQDIRPSSVAAWAGRKIFEGTGRIDTVAQRLGMRSLDRTARFIGWDWAPTSG